MRVKNITADPRSGKIGRDRIDEKSIQRVVENAIRATRIIKTNGRQTLRCSYATHASWLWLQRRKPTGITDMLSAAFNSFWAQQYQHHHDLHPWVKQRWQMRYWSGKGLGLNIKKLLSSISSDHYRWTHNEDNENARTGVPARLNLIR